MNVFFLPPTDILSTSYYYIELSVFLFKENAENKFDLSLAGFYSFLCGDFTYISI